MFELRKEKVRVFFEKIFTPLLVWTGRAVSVGYFSKNFYPSTYLDKGWWNAHPFPLVWEKFLENIFSEELTPSLICTSNQKCIPKMSGFKEMFTNNSHILLSGNIYPFTYLDKGWWNGHPFSACSEKFLQFFYCPSLIWNWKSFWHPISDKFLEIIFIPSLSPSEIGFCTP